MVKDRKKLVVDFFQNQNKNQGVNNLIYIWRELEKRQIEYATVLVLRELANLITAKAFNQSIGGISTLQGFYY